MVPISLHREQPGQARATRTGGWSCRCRSASPTPFAGCELIAAETAARKDKAHPQVGSGIFRFALAQRAFLRLFARQRL